MDDAHVQEILRNPKFQELVQKQRKLSWSLTILMLVIYFGFILLVAYNPEFLHSSFSGVITWGIPLGIGVIVASDPSNYETWDQRCDPIRVEPDPELLNEFIALQVSDGAKEELAAWVR